MRKCLDSILQQTEKDWELLAVNDFSEDDSLEILEEYARKDARIQVFINNRKGIIPALRLAFKHSKGDLITRMDADDRMMNHKLENLKSLLIENGKGYLSTGYVMYFSDEGVGNGYRKYEEWLNELTESQSNFSEIYKECVIPSPCWMSWRTDLKECGAFDHDTYPEDYDLCFRFYKNKLKVVSTKKTLHLWQDHPERSSRTQEVYAHNQYFNLKLPYFLELEYDAKRPLVIWGAGRKGKRLAKMLFDRQIPYYWFCNNRNKWGIKLYGSTMENYEMLPHLWKPQVIVAVASPGGQKEILDYLEVQNLKKGEDYFFFC